MIYTDVCAGDGRFHTVQCPINSSRLWLFDGIARTAPDSGGFVRLAASGSRLLAVAQGHDTGQLVVMNDAGAYVVAQVTTGVSGVAVETLRPDRFRVAAVVGLTWKSWLASGDLMTFDVESEQPTLNGSSQGWTDFRDGVPVWADANRNVTINGLHLTLPMSRGQWTLGQSNIKDGADIYDYGTNLAMRVASSDSPVQPRLAVLEDGRAIVALSANAPLFVESKDFTAPWPPVVTEPPPPVVEPPIVVVPPVGPPVHPPIPPPVLQELLPMNARTLYASNFQPEGDQYVYPIDGGNYLSVIADSGELRPDGTPNKLDSELFTWTKGSGRAVVHPGGGKFRTCWTFLVDETR